MSKVAYLRVGPSHYRFELAKGTGRAFLEDQIKRAARRGDFIRLDDHSGILASAITHYRIEKK